MLAAMKFHCYVRALPAAPAAGAAVLLDAVLSGAQCVHGAQMPSKPLALSRICCRVPLVPVTSSAAEILRHCLHVHAGTTLSSILLECLFRMCAGIAFMYTLTRRRRVASAHQQGLAVECCTRVPQAHVRCLAASP